MRPSEPQPVPHLVPQPVPQLVPLSYIAMFLIPPAIMLAAVLAAWLLRAWVRPAVPRE